MTPTLKPEVHPSPLRLPTCRGRGGWVALAALVLACASCGANPGADPDSTPDVPIGDTSRAPIDTVATPDSSASDAVPTDSVTALPTRVNRTPETDPMFFEGIPNWEDVLALREGDWLVVLGSAERTGAPRNPTITRASDPSLAAIQQALWNEGSIPWIISSEELPAFAPGLTVIVLSPMPRGEATERLADLRSVVPDAYVKSGW